MLWYRKQQVFRDIRCELLAVSVTEVVVVVAVVETAKKVSVVQMIDPFLYLLGDELS